VGWELKGYWRLRWSVRWDLYLSICFSLI
jgi:hypothetical protein